MNVHSIFCKVNPNSNRLFMMRETHFLSVPLSTIDYDQESITRSVYLTHDCVLGL